MRVTKRESPGERVNISIDLWLFDFQAQQVWVSVPGARHITSGPPSQVPSNVCTRTSSSDKGRCMDSFQVIQQQQTWPRCVTQDQRRQLQFFKSSVGIHPLPQVASNHKKNPHLIQSVLSSYALIIYDPSEVLVLDSVLNQEEIWWVSPFTI